MKRPPAKKSVIASRIRFYKTISILLCLSGFLIWLGWKSPWARKPVDIIIQTPDMPKYSSAALPMTKSLIAKNAVLMHKNAALHNNIKKYGKSSSVQGN